MLSTGTKIWHLRDESTFYPKTNFVSATEELPDNATVIMCFGEIDCREALLHCVEQFRYDVSSVRGTKLNFISRHIFIHFVIV